MTSRTGLSRWLGAASGLLTAAAAMGVAQLFAGFTVPAASPVVAVGEAAIDHTPLAVKDWATAEFGTSDKTVLLAGVLVVVFLYSMVVGVLAMRRLAVGFAGLAIFAGLGLAAALTRHDASGSYAVPTIFGAAAGALVLWWLVVTARATVAASAAASASSASAVAGARGARARGARGYGGADRLPPIAFDPGDDWAAGGRAGDHGAGRGSGPGAADGSLPGGAAGSGGQEAADGRDDAADSGSPAEAAGSGSGSHPAERSGEDAPIGWVAAGSGAPGGRGTGGDGGSRDGGSRDGGPRPLRAGPPTAWPAGPGTGVSPARRQFLTAAGVSIAAAAIGEVAGRTLATRRNVAAAQAALRFPRAAVPAPPLPAGVNLPVPGITSFITPNSQFYRVDTALIVPQVDPSNWQLRVHGMVDREVVITFDQLLRRPLIEDYITLCCVSNPVDGPYIGNAKWLGASLASLIRSAGPQRGADQLLATSVDGFTSGSPLQVVLDGRDALLAVAMNGAALPTEHGFPARLVVPGLYGYVSACKWVVDIEVTTFAQAQAYWVPRGWSAMGPIKTESRIDVPTDGSSLRPGRVAVAGVAWAQHKGIEAVEVRVDNGPWNEATLAAVPDIDTWRQWVWQWNATSGTHLIEARATDKTGYTQTSVVENVAPNGASGYPSTQVNVS